MSDNAKSIELYELIIARLRESGNAPNQLAAYEGSLDFIKQYATAEEAMEALATSPWYTAVAQGMALDSIEAVKKAAAEQGMDDVVAVYDAKLKEVKDNYLSAWDTAYETEAQKLFAEHFFAREKEVQDHLDEIEKKVDAVEDTKVDIETDWAEILNNKAEVIEIGTKELAKLRRATAVCTAPESFDGKYSFECSEKEVF